MKILLCVISILLVCTVKLNTATILNSPLTVRQPDGTLLHCYVSGNEYKHWMHTSEQLIIEQDSNTGEYYITSDKLSDIALQNNLNNISEYISKDKNTFQADTTKNNKGTLTNIVVFVRFADDSEYETDFSFYDSIFNSNSKQGISVDNYFTETSYSLLSVKSYFFPNPIDNQVQSLKLKEKRGFYIPAAASNPIGYVSVDDSELRKSNMLKEIMQYLSSVVPTELKLDVNKPGYLDNVTIILKGAVDGWGRLIWPQQSAISKGQYGFNYLINDINVYDYMILVDDVIDLGVICHEFFHSLGAPDLYRYENANNILPVYIWDLMGSQFQIPQHMNSYMKYRYGKWIDNIPTIALPGKYYLKPLTSSTQNCYMINSKNPNEYFLLEYRKPLGKYEHSLGQTLIIKEQLQATQFDGGLLIYRIDKTQKGKGNSASDNVTPDEVFVYRPNGSSTYNGEPWNSAFNSKYLSDEFSSKSNPAPSLFDGTMDNIKINDIYEHNNCLYFTYHKNNITFIKSPAEGEHQVSRRPVIVWDLLVEPQTYYIQVSSNPNFSALEINQTMYNDSIFYSNITLQPNKYYYVRVGISVNSTGNNNTFIWSNVVYFKTSSELGIPQYYDNTCAGEDMELKYDLYDKSYSNTLCDIYLSDANGSFVNQILIGTDTLKLQKNSTIPNSFSIFLPDSLITGYDYRIKLQSKKNHNIYVISNKIKILGLIEAKLYTAVTDGVGSGVVCQNSTSKIYFEPILTKSPNSYYKYVWSCKNCQILMINETERYALISWNKTGYAEVVLTAFNQQNCQKEYSKKVFVNEIPNLNFTIKDSLCADFPATYYLKDEPYMETTIQVDGTYKRKNKDSIEITWAKTGTGFIKIVRKLPNGCADSIVTIQPLVRIPKINITSPTNGLTGFCVDSMQCYTASMSNQQTIDTNNYSITWKMNTGEIVGSDSSTNCYIIVSKYDDMTEDRLLIELTVTDKKSGCYEVLTKEILLYELPNTPSISQIGEQLKCNIYSTKYRWLYNDMELPNSNFQSIDNIGEGIYHVEIFNDNYCSSISAPYFLTSIKDINIDCSISTNRECIVIRLNNVNLQNINVKLFNILGENIDITTKNTSSYGEQIIMTLVPNDVAYFRGVYFLKLFDNNNVIYQDIVIF